MSKVVFYGLLALLSWVGLAQAEDKLHYNVISLQVSAEQEVANDLMQVWLTVQHEHKQAAQAAAQVNRDSQWALAQIAGFSEVKKHSLNYSSQPRYDERRVVAWTVRQQFRLESQQHEALAELVTTLQQKLQISRMAFVPSRDTRLAVENDLTTEVLQAFRAKAARVAEGLGQQGYEIVDIELGQQRPPLPRQRMEATALSSLMSSYADQTVAVDAGSSLLKVTAAGRIQLH